MMALMKGHEKADGDDEDKMMVTITGGLVASVRQQI